MTPDTGASVKRARRWPAQAATLLLLCIACALLWATWRICGSAIQRGYKGLD